MRDALAELDAERRALVLAAVLRAGSAAPTLLARGPEPERCRAAAQALLALPPRTRAERRALETLGGGGVVAAFGVAGPPAIAQLAARLGEPWGSQLVIEARRLRRHDREEGQRALAEMAELARRAQHGRTLILRAGARRLAPALAARGGDLLRQVAQRLPRPTGQLL